MRGVIVDRFKRKTLEVLVTRDEVSRNYTGTQAERVLAVVNRILTEENDKGIIDKMTFVVIPNL